MTEHSAASRPSTLVSVCMITWNHVRYVRQAIESILAQDAPFGIELIVGDDCSTDGASAIIDELAQAHHGRLIVLRGPRNVGMHENASRCFRRATGRYIAICEGDDFWHDVHKLRDQVALMEAAPEMTLCHSDFDRMTRFHVQKERHKKSSPGLLAIGHAYPRLLRAWSVMSATAVYRASILKDFEGTPLDNRAWPFGDYNRLLYAATQGTFGYLDRSTATYRKVRGSAGNQGADGALRIELANQACIEAFMAHWPVDDADKAVARSAAWSRIRRAAFWAVRRDVFETASAELPLESNRLRRALLRIPALLRALRTGRDYLSSHVNAMPR